MKHKYHTVHLTDEQILALIDIQDLLDRMAQGPYGGKAKVHSKGEAVAYLCHHLRKPLEEHVEKVAAAKREAAAEKRVNNNPGIVPGVSRNKGVIYGRKT
jgi:hypothetical protein